MSTDKKQIARAAMIVMGAFVLSRVLGLAREIIISSQFGTSGELDAYLAAFRLPDLLFQLIAGGALGNIIDRIRLGSVTDFLQFNFYFIPFEFSWKRYPAFNVADSAICVGVFLLVIPGHTAKDDDAADPA